MYKMMKCPSNEFVFTIAYRKDILDGVTVKLSGDVGLFISRIRNQITDMKLNAVYSMLNNITNQPIRLKNYDNIESIPVGNNSPIDIAELFRIHGSFIDLDKRTTSLDNLPIVRLTYRDLKIRVYKNSVHIANLIHIINLCVTQEIYYDLHEKRLIHENIVVKDEKLRSDIISHLEKLDIVNEIGGLFGDTFVRVGVYQLMITSESLSDRDATKVISTYQENECNEDTIVYTGIEGLLKHISNKYI